MRIWSLHPQYLDAKGLVALWRETLLAQKVLRGETKGYRNHPQLNRFKQHANPLGAIATYLREIHAEAERRGYHFDASKIITNRTKAKIDVTDGQIAFELLHLKAKLRVRDPAVYARLAHVEQPTAHPLFTVVRGEIEAWEVR